MGMAKMNQLVAGVSLANRVQVVAAEAALTNLSVGA